MTNELVRLKRLGKKELKKPVVIGVIVAVLSMIAVPLASKLFIGSYFTPMFTLLPACFFCCGFLAQFYEIDRSNREQYRLTLHHLDKKTLIKYSTSMELTASERDIAVSVLNEKHKGWSLT